MFLKKHFLFLGLVCVLKFNLPAQLYKPYNLKNIYWLVQLCKSTDGSNPINGRYINEMNYMICNDTVIINNLKYRTIYQKSFQYDVNVNPFPGNYAPYGYLRQDSVLKRSWLYLPEWGKDTLLMDYNLKVGDVINRGYYYHATVNANCNTSWKIVKVGFKDLGTGINAKVFYTDTTGRQAFFVEGAAHPYGVFHNKYNFFPLGEKYCLPVGYCSNINAVYLTPHCKFNMVPVTERAPDKTTLEVFTDSTKTGFAIRSLIPFTEIELVDVYNNTIIKTSTPPTDYYVNKTLFLKPGCFLFKVRLKNKLVVVTKFVIAG